MFTPSASSGSEHATVATDPRADTQDTKGTKLRSPVLAPISGVHTLYLVFEGGDGVATIDSFRFS